MSIEEKRARDASPERKLKPSPQLTVRENIAVEKQLKGIPCLEQIIFCAEEARIRAPGAEFRVRSIRNYPRMSKLEGRLESLCRGMTIEQKILAHVFVQLMWTEIHGKPRRLSSPEPVLIFDLDCGRLLLTEDKIYIDNRSGRAVWYAKSDTEVESPSFREIVKSFVLFVDEFHETRFKHPIGTLESFEVKGEF